MDGKCSTYFMPISLSFNTGVNLTCLHPKIQRKVAASSLEDVLF